VGEVQREGVDRCGHLHSSAKFRWIDRIVPSVDRCCWSGTGWFWSAMCKQRGN